MNKAEGKSGLINIFYGEEKLLIDEAVEHIKSKLNKDYKDLNYSCLKDKEIQLSEAVRGLMSVPFMDKFRIIHIKNDDLLNREHQGNKKDLDSFFDYLQNPVSSSVLIIETLKLDKRNKIYKAVSRNFNVRQFGKLDYKEFSLWTKQRFEKYGAVISKSDLNYFVKICGYEFKDGGIDLLAADSEIKKIISSGRDKIDKSVIDEVLSRNYESNIFAYIDALFLGNGKEVCRQLENLMYNNSSAVYIISMIERQIGIMLSLFLTENLKSDVSKQLGLHPYVVKKTLSLIKRMSYEKLLELYNFVYDMDFRIKTGRIKELAALDVITFKIIRFAENGR